MAGLQETTARLAAYRQRWQNLNGGGARATAARPSRLTEITSFGADPGNLRMLAYVPERLGAKAPLVVVLHGCKQDASGYEIGAGWSALADRYGFALLLPEQRTANNINACFNWFLPGDTTRGSGEAASIRQMIEHMVEAHAIDRNRIYVTGLSAGGAMTAVMLATYPEVFAGGAIIAGLPYGVATSVQEALNAMFKGDARPADEWGNKVRAASAHRGPWPRLSIWHGGADATVQATNAAEIEKQWTNVHGVDPRAAEADSVDGYPRRVWRNALREAVVESYSITGMAHGTPIAAGKGDENFGEAAPYILEAGISSSYRIAQFWGLTASAGARAQPSSKPTSAAEASVIYLGRSQDGKRDAARDMPSSAHAARRMRLNPQQVISKALRAAGLLRP